MTKSRKPSTTASLPRPKSCPPSLTNRTSKAVAVGFAHEHFAVKQAAMLMGIEIARMDKSGRTMKRITKSLEPLREMAAVKDHIDYSGLHARKVNRSCRRSVETDITAYAKAHSYVMQGSYTAAEVSVQLMQWCLDAAIATSEVEKLWMSRQGRKYHLACNRLDRALANIASLGMALEWERSEGRISCAKAGAA